MSTMKGLDTFSKQLNKFTGKKTSGAAKPKDVFPALCILEPWVAHRGVEETLRGIANCA